MNDWRRKPHIKCRSVRTYAIERGMPNTVWKSQTARRNRTGNVHHFFSAISHSMETVPGALGRCDFGSFRVEGNSLLLVSVYWFVIIKFRAVPTSAILIWFDAATSGTAARAAHKWFQFHLWLAICACDVETHRRCRRRRETLTSSILKASTNNVIDSTLADLPINIAVRWRITGILWKIWFGFFLQRVGKRDHWSLHKWTEFAFSSCCLKFSADVSASSLFFLPKFTNKILPWSKSPSHFRFWSSTCDKITVSWLYHDRSSFSVF